MLDRTSFYSTERWRALRQKILRRDDYSCRICGERNHCGMVVDHIQPRRLRPDLAYAESNLQVLCKAHHDGLKKRMENALARPKIDSLGYPEGW